METFKFGDKVKVVKKYKSDPFPAFPVGAIGEITCGENENDGLYLVIFNGTTRYVPGNCLALLMPRKYIRKHLRSLASFAKKNRCLPHIAEFMADELFELIEKI